MTLRARLEESIQKELIAYIAAIVPRAIVFAVPNASKRSLNGRPYNMVPGLMAGAPDLVVLLPGGRAVMIEVKTPKGRSSEKQVAFSGRCNAIGHSYFVARSQDDVRRAFAVLGVETREAQA
jgi:hypothetical protein